MKNVVVVWCSSSRFRALGLPFFEIRPWLNVVQCSPRVGNIGTSSIRHHFLEYLLLSDLAETL